jgi:hypothetical protein
MRRLSLVIIVLSGFFLGCAPKPSTDNHRDTSMKESGELILRSMVERASYYLLSVEREGDFLKTLHKRVSAQSVGFSLTLLDCSSGRYKDLGYGVGKVENIRLYAEANWVELVIGSSKSDLLNFVCSKGL